ncbi:MAG: DUF4332 domain-containing protein [Acidobacteriota bacterium]
MTEETEHSAPHRFSATAVLVGASLGLAAMWWLRQNFTDADGCCAGPADGPSAAADATNTGRPTAPSDPAPATPSPESPAAEADAAPAEGAPVAQAAANDAADDGVASAAAPAPKAKAAPKAKTRARRRSTGDDLTRIEGIGPKMASVLTEAGIGTYAELSTRPPDGLRELLGSINSRYRMIDPETWPEQAGLAAEGRFDALKALQAELKGGRRV